MLGIEARDPIPESAARSPSCQAHDRPSRLPVFLPIAVPLPKILSTGTAGVTTGWLARQSFLRCFLGRLTGDPGRQPAFLGWLREHQLRKWLDFIPHIYGIIAVGHPFPSR